MGTKNTTLPLEQLHRAIIAVRSAVSDRMDHDSLYRLLDKIELLPNLIQDYDDSKSRVLFATIINELASEHPAFAILAVGDGVVEDELVSV